MAPAVCGALAVAASDPPVGPGRYRFVETHSWYSSSAGFPDGESLTYLREEVTQLWVPVDFTEEWQETRTSTGNRKWIDGSDQVAAEVGFELDQPSTETYRARGGAFFAPVDPAGYREEIIVEPETGAFIGERDVDPDGVVSGFTAVTSGVAEEIGVEPKR